MHSFALTALAFLEDQDKGVPADKDVVAGPVGAIVIVAMIVAVALIGWALTRSLRTAQRAKGAGVYGDDPAQEDDNDQSTGSA